MKKLILFAVMLFVMAPAIAELDVDAQPVFLLATERQEGTPYARVVVAVAPYQGGGHAGVILNQPTSVSLAELFPDFAPARQVAGPAYSGGHVMQQQLFAVVKSQERPSALSTELAPGAWLVEDETTIDRFMERAPNESRYYIGRLHWLPGQLNAAVARGLLVAVPADAAKLFLPDTSQLYDELASAGPRPTGAREI